MKDHIAICAAASTLTCAAVADFVGWTSTVRSMGSGSIVNVFAVTNSATDRLVSVYGGRPSNPGFVRTNSPGGFIQGAGAEGAFRPDGDQAWTSMDSFLTVGGGFESSTGTWTANGSTVGDPGWQFDGPGSARLDGFATLPGIPGVVNPWASAVPTQAGWYSTGSGAIAQSLAPVSSIRSGYRAAGGVRYGSSSGAAAAGMHGFLVAQLYVADLRQSMIEWNMGATVRRANGTVQQGEFAFTVTQAPAPASIALFLANLRARRRGRWPGRSALG